MKIIVLAGGEGTRLFPLSRKNYPKQFLNISSNLSLLANTIERYRKIANLNDIVIVTNEKYSFHVREELKKINAESVHVIEEPCPKNTSPAVAIGVKYIMDCMITREDEEIFVAPVDHVIRPVDKFLDIMRVCFDYANEKKLVTIGITPTKPETGYGYIKVSGNYLNGYHVQRFIEKPRLEAAETFLREGSYFWNSGMYAFTLDTYLDELKMYSPDLYSFIKSNRYSEAIEKFSTLKSISFDYDIAEKSFNLITVPMNIYWNDVGTWDSLYEHLEKDNEGNITLGDCISIDCKNSMLLSNERLVAAVGLEDIIVVETDDVIMVAKKGESQRVKEVFDSLTERELTSDHSTVARPWGSYSVISQGDGYKVKKIRVSPGHMLTMQSHKNRSEHWVVINGEATVIIGDKQKEKNIKKNESIFVPINTKHKLMNKTKEMLEIIEVQNGEYLEEDDVERYDQVTKM